MSRWLHVVAVHGARGAGQDRAVVVDLGDALTIALADGAGGTGGGDLAAQAIVDAAVAGASTRPAWADVLADLDRAPRRLGHGQATAVLLTITARGLAGASVGDSAAWLIDGDAVVELTADQRRKPLVGAGAAVVAFAAGPLAGATLLVASDGLVNYAPRRAIAALARLPDLAAAARQLVDLVRLPTGALPDDTSLVLCRAADAGADAGAGDQ